MDKIEKKVKKYSWLSALLAFVIFLLLEFLTLLIPRRILLTAKFLLLAASVAVGLLAPKPREPKKRKRKENPRFGLLRGICFTIGALLLLSLVFDGGDYSYTQDFPFWGVALVLSLLLIVAALFLLPKKIFETKSGIGWLLLGGLLVGFLLWFVVHSFIMHFNYMLDLTPPIEYNAIIEQKEHHHHRKSPDSYEFEITADGKTFDLEVELRIYDHYEVGDTFTFYRYEGAFGKEFYLSDPTQKGDS
jgi:hypothetical protein